MNFEEALKLMREGKKVHRSSCNNGFILLKDNIHIIDIYSELNSISVENILANDWEEYHEEPELLPCPFCGSDAIRSSPTFLGSSGYIIFCLCCSAYMSGANKLDAINKWNTRCK